MSEEFNQSKFYSALLTRFETLEDELNKLDAATGDGDHGSTLVKGLRAIVDSDGATPVKTFRRAAGGASGSLFAEVIGALDKTLRQEKDLVDALQLAATRITQIGQAVAGDKTMLDALLPAAASPDTEVKAIVDAAVQGANATVDMVAKRGRARYVEGGGVGHKDAGATSVAEMLSVFAEHHL